MGVVLVGNEENTAPYQSGRSLWNLMRIGRNFSCCQPCSGHSSLRGKCFAPGTGLATRVAPHFAHFTVAESFSSR